MSHYTDDIAEWTTTRDLHQRWANFLNNVSGTYFSGDVNEFTGSPHTWLNDTWRPANPTVDENTAAQAGAIYRLWHALNNGGFTAEEIQGHTDAVTYYQGKIDNRQAKIDAGLVGDETMPLDYTDDSENPVTASPTEARVEGSPE